MVVSNTLKVSRLYVVQPLRVTSQSKQFEPDCGTACACVRFGEVNCAREIDTLFEEVL